MKTYGSKFIVSLVAFLAVVGGIFAYVAKSGSSKDIVSPIVQDNPSQPVNGTGSEASSTSGYKDGTYAARGTYRSPEGSESIDVSLTLKNNIVTAATVTGNAHDRTSVRFQNLFIGGFKSYVVGKSIDSINLDTVSGSSLTPIGFNDALAQIKSQAKA